MQSLSSRFVGLAVVLLLAFASLRGAQLPMVAAGDLVRRAVDVEMHPPDEGTKFIFQDYKKTPAGSSTKVMVQTDEATAGLVVAYNDKPLGPKRRQEEWDRVKRFIRNPDELKRKQQQEKQDRERISQIIRAMPDAFLFENDGTEPGRAGVGQAGKELVRLKFRPNPKYDPPSRVEQALTGMEGTILVDANKNRIARIDGTLSRQVSFGWGILGHLDSGGHILVEQGEVGGGHWMITRMDLSFTGRLLLFRSINVQSTEMYSDFKAMNGPMTFAQGLDKLKEQEAQWLERQQKKVAQK